MPMLLRVARVEDLPAGASLDVKVRGQKIHLSNDGGAIRAVAGKGDGASAYRTEVRGGLVYVAMDLDRERALASVHENMRAPTSDPR